MSLPTDINDREHRKFRQDPDDPNQSVVAVVNPDGSYISQQLITGFEGGQFTVGLTEVEVTFTGVTKSIHIEADESNTGFIYVGSSGVTTSTGMVKLEPGSSISIDLKDTDSPVYVISDTAGQIVRKMALL